MAVKPLLAGIDAGGTTFKLGLADDAGALLVRDRVETGAPAETIAAASQRLRELAEDLGGSIKAVGIASFGPVDVDPNSSSYGTILNTPKEGWSQTPLAAGLRNELDVPATLDTDVNAALLAEREFGAAQNTKRAAYVTIGTGVGVGLYTGSDFAGRPYHPELGHIRVERHPEDQNFEGVCAIHGACLEGLVSAPALIERYGRLEGLGRDHTCWDMAGWYLAQLSIVIMLGWRVERVVLGGGVMNADALLPAARRQYTDLMAGYLSPEECDAERVIQCAALGDDAGIVGAILLAGRGRRRRPISLLRPR